jgi:serine/threonine protein kinase
MRRVGRYLILKQLGSGGMGSVYLGRLEEPGATPSRPVAIKRPHDDLLTDPRARAMFFREVRVASQIHHPNVVSTLEVISEGDELHYVMEYVAGASAAQLQATAQAEGRSLPVPVALRIIADMLAGLHAAHEARSESGAPLGIIHRDISPHNVLVGVDGVARITDFGIAKTITNQTVTTSGGLKGKVRYVAPEQIRGVPCTRASDIYSACVVAWELLANDALFSGETEAAVLARVLEGNIKPLATYAPAVPPAVEAMLARGLRSRPEERPQTAEEIVRCLEGCGFIAAPSEVGEMVSRSTGFRERDPDAHAWSEDGETASIAARPRSLHSAPAFVALPVPHAYITSTRTSLGAWLALVAAVAILLGGTWKLWQRHRSTDDVAEDLTPQAEAVPPGPPIAALAGPRDSTIAAEALPTAQPVPSSAPPAGKRALAPKSRKSCDVPYVVDSAGIRHIRAECY